MLMIGVLVFFLIQFVNVFVSTIKSVLTVNGSRTTAAVINAVSYTISAVGTKLLTEQSFEVAIAVTFTTNMIGVYLAKFILDISRKEKLWTVMATIRDEWVADIERSLSRRSLQYTLLEAENGRNLMHIYSYSKAESSMIREILSKYKIKYSVMETNLSL